ncbi:extracellular solute-binding protein [Anaerocolumna sp. AGMB13025]|uniref:extracellular solute-binding protein n=1 Tax=Anaerocolumna sp. AGMB13025 TaxID=3039116 RepID=UPI00241CC72A|nr:extracellular solute-binding protein [Anaerocolumna sp. AGMB13025]WFR55744.1 extracellular solute-binding protein [Anaerocolumna sp. AGMB13025]
MKKMISILLVLCMTLTLVGCKGKASTSVEGTNTATEAETKQSESNETANSDSSDPKVRYDLSQPANLVFYLVGDPGKDYQAVVDELNKYLTEKINTTIEFRFTTWTDWSQKYNLVLSSGEQCDLMYAADWTNYSTLAKTGAFYALDDLLKEYAPDITGLIDQKILDMCKVDGALYCVPADQKTYAASGIRYREDLRKKYNLPVPNTLENFEAYISGIQKNDPDQGLLSPITVSNNYSDAFYMNAIFDLKYSKALSNYGLLVSYDSPMQVMDYWRSQDFIDNMKLLKKWADMGFWSKSSLSKTEEDSFDEGLIVASVGGMNQDKWIGSYNMAKDKHPDWEVGYVTYGLVNGNIAPASPLQNATVIPHNSKDPQRALIALDFLMTDEKANDLVQYGIQGKHWNLIEGKYYEEIKDSGFSYENMNTWDLRNHLLKKEMKPTGDTAYDDMIASYDAAAAKSKWEGKSLTTGFIEDYSSYEIERANLNSVIAQYLTPIQAGLVEDVEASINEFLKEADAAGLKKIQDSYKEQWLAHCVEFGYK